MNKFMIFNKKIQVDPLEVEKEENTFYIKNIHKGDVIFDIGANVGELSILFSKFTGNNGTVHAFEPTPETFKRLTNIVLSTNRNNIILNNFVVSEKDGFETLNIYDVDHSGWNTMANRDLQKYGVNINSPEKIQLPSIKIDTYCKQNNIPCIDLLKIDVEGAEINVLRGSSEMFKKRKIKLCVFEFGQTVHDMGYTSKEIESFFKKCNYQVRNVVPYQKKYPVVKETMEAQFSIHYAYPK
jgi:FkbM family methyltransferase